MPMGSFFGERDLAEAKSGLVDISEGNEILERDEFETLLTDTGKNAFFQNWIFALVRPACIPSIS